MPAPTLTQASVFLVRVHENHGVLRLPTNEALVQKRASRTGCPFASTAPWNWLRFGALVLGGLTNASWFEIAVWP